VTSVGVSVPREVHPQPNNGLLASPRNRTAIVALLLAVVTLALYYPVRSHPFLNYDDTLYVTQNDQVQAGLTWLTVKWAFTTFEVGTWHPLAWLSHALDCQLFGLDPAGHHSTSLLLHALNVVLLFWVLQAATGYAGRSAMVAALFALHPINVESVAWIAERKNVLSMVFFLLALGAYRWYAREPRLDRYLLVAVLFALGLLSKPQVITFPFVLLLWDYWPLQRMITKEHDSAGPAGAIPARSFSWLVLEKLPLFALSAASAVITMAATRTDTEKILYPRHIRLEAAIVGYLQYLGKAVWPSRLAVFYPHPGNSLQPWHVYTALFLLAAVTALVWEARSRRYLLVGWLWFVGTLVPMLGLQPVGYKGMQGIADRYAYLPFIGLFIMICWGVADLWAGTIPRLVYPVERAFGPVSASILGNVGASAPQEGGQKYRRVETRLPSEGSPRRGAEAPLGPDYWMALVCAAILLALGTTAHRQISYWSDNTTLWTHALQVTGPNWLAENNLGKILMSEGQEEAGVEHFFRAVAIYPNDPVSNMNIALYEQKRGNLPEAVAHYKVAITMSHDNQLKVAALNNLGRAYTDLGDPARARECFAAAAHLSQ
jgi:protein O-mannosyl-transferase